MRYAALLLLFLVAAGLIASRCAQPVEPVTTRGGHEIGKNPIQPGPEIPGWCIEGVPCGTPPPESRPVNPKAK